MSSLSFIFLHWWSYFSPAQEKESMYVESLPGCTVIARALWKVKLFAGLILLWLKPTESPACSESLHRWNLSQQTTGSECWTTAIFRQGLPAVAISTGWVPSEGQQCLISTSEKRSPWLAWSGSPTGWEATSHTWPNPQHQDHGEKQDKVQETACSRLLPYFNINKDASGNMTWSLRGWTEGLCLPDGAPGPWLTALLRWQQPDGE